ncbi:MAG: DUF4920 domain-containing protein [Ignavibacteria bacterium]
MFNVIKKISIAAIALFLFSSISYSQHDENVKMLEKDAKMSDEPVGIKMADGILYGKDYDASMEVLEFSDLIKNASANNDKIVIVKGNVSEVCQAMGCWIVMSEGSNSVRVKTLDEFFVPKDVAGSKAVVVGKFKMTVITEDLAKHYNDESKNPLMKTDDIKGPQKVYEMDAMGIKILYPVTDTNKQ